MVGEILPCSKFEFPKSLAQTVVNQGGTHFVRVISGEITPSTSYKQVAGMWHRWRGLKKRQCPGRSGFASHKKRVQSEIRATHCEEIWLKWFQLALILPPGGLSHNSPNRSVSANLFRGYSDTGRTDIKFYCNQFSNVHLSFLQINFDSFQKLFKTNSTADMKRIERIQTNYPSKKMWQRECSTKWALFSF